MKIKPFAFVLMPFDDRFSDIYRLGIQASAIDCGIVAERVDEQIYSESILERIYRQIDNADFIIAEMTGKNPNVFYEVGYAHAKGKLCILITQDAADIPFDLKHHRHLVYGKSIQKLKEYLALEFEWLKSEIKRKKESFFEVNFKYEKEALLEDKKWRLDGSFSLQIDIHNRSDRRSPEIDAIYLRTTNKWEFAQNGEKCPSIDVGAGSRRFLVKPPLPRLASGAWAQVKIDGSRVFWTKFSGEEKKEEYEAKGNANIEISTSEGKFEYNEYLDIKFNEFPF